jgi:hypothetical protein
MNKSLINEQPGLLIFDLLPPLPLLVYFYVVKAFFSCSNKKKSALNTRFFHPVRLLDRWEYINDFFSTLPAVIRAYLLIKFEEKFQPTLLLEPPLVLET